MEITLHMKSRLLVLFLSTPSIYSMDDRQARKSGMQTLETIKMATVCCITFCNKVDDCSGRKAIESLSRSANQSYSDPQQMPSQTGCCTCFKSMRCCLPAPKK